MYIGNKNNELEEPLEEKELKKKYPLIKVETRTLKSSEIFPGKIIKIE